MTEELLINVTPQETRVATVENGMLTEIWIERVRKIGLVGTIFQGTVKRVLPGMEAAFVDIGLEKAAFLHVSDVLNPSPSNADEDESSPGYCALAYRGTKAGCSGQQRSSGYQGCARQRQPHCTQPLSGHDALRAEYWRLHSHRE